MSDVEDERPALQRLADNDPTMTAYVDSATPFPFLFPLLHTRYLGAAALCFSRCFLSVPGTPRFGSPPSGLRLPYPPVLHSLLSVNASPLVRRPLPLHTLCSHGPPRLTCQPKWSMAGRRRFHRCAGQSARGKHKSHAARVSRPFAPSTSRAPSSHRRQ